MAMTIISKPPGRGPLFGGKTVILFGGIDKEAMRRWQERVREATIPLPPLQLLGERDSGDQ
jgi:hypothetical protein